MYAHHHQSLTALMPLLMVVITFGLGRIC